MRDSKIVIKNLVNIGNELPLTIYLFLMFILGVLIYIYVFHRYNSEDK